MVDTCICGYELPTNLQNFMQNGLTDVKIFQKVLGRYFLKHPVYQNITARLVHRDSGSGSGRRITSFANSDPQQ